MIRKAGVYQVVCLVALGLTTPSFAAPPSAEAILAEAARYTVRITGANRIALNQDEAGTRGGAGFLIDRQRGWILTNAHVASRSPGTLKISFKGRPYVPARRIHVDPVIDAAILKVDLAAIPSEASSAELDCADLPAIGTGVAAFGHPWGLNYSASRGIVSGVPVLNQMEQIQSDASINPGNSGGPLISLASGKVVGLNSATYNPDDDDTSTPVSLAEPIPHICRILDLLKSGRKAGVQLLPVAIATSDDDPRPRVAVARQGSGGAKAGDIILSVNGSAPLRNISDLTRQLRGVSGSVSVELERDDKTLTVTMTPQAVADPLEVKAVNLSGVIITKPWRLDEIEVNPERHLIVDYVLSDSSAADQPVEASDQVIAVDGRAFTDPDALYEYLAKLQAEAVVRLIVRGLSGEGTAFHEYHYIEVPVGLPDITLVQNPGPLEAAQAPPAASIGEQ